MLKRKKDILKKVVILRINILLKEVRKSKEISLYKLSKMTGISKSHLSYIEREEKEPSISMMVRIAMALKVDIKELYNVKK